MAMYSDNFALPNYPEWYKIEKETENTIKKLTNLRELSYYLRNSDEYIRRLAILRINELKLKDSIDVLKEILDDRMESQNNKELAAWAIKSISLKWNIDLFISHKLLNKYTGNERSIDLNKVSFNDSISSVKFEFSTSLINSELNLDKENFRNSQDVDFDMPFSMKEWFEAWFQQFLSNAGTVFVNLPSLVFKFIGKSSVFIVKNIFLRLFQAIRRNISKGYASYKSRPKKLKGKETDIFESRYRSSYIEKVNPFNIIKNALYKLLYIIFSPVRLILRHRKFSLASLVAVYLLLTYTTYGKIITYKYAGLELEDTQSRIYCSAKELLSYAWNEVNGIFSATSINNTTGNTIETQNSNAGTPIDEVKTEPTKIFRVTAKAGLNIRKAPNASSAKVANKMLAYNSTVTYLDKTQNDSKGMPWYYVQTPDGKTGWVYSKWLEETRSDDNAIK